MRDAAEMRDSTLLGLLGRRYQHRLDRRSCGAGDMRAQPVGVRRSLPRLRRVDHRVYPGIGVVFEHDRHVADMPPRIRRCVLLAFTRVESEVLTEENLGRFELIAGLQSFPDLAFAGGKRSVSRACARTGRKIVYSYAILCDLGVR